MVARITRHVVLSYGGKDQTPYHTAEGSVKHRATRRLGVAPTVGKQGCAASGPGTLAPYSLRFGKGRRLGQRHILQSATLTS
jgi:hypothetical protein